MFENMNFWPNNFVNLVWFYMTVFLIINYLLKYQFKLSIGNLVNSQVISYGKSTEKSYLPELPKRFFVHFYIWANIWNFYLIYVMMNGGYDVTNTFHQLLIAMTTDRNKNQPINKRCDLMLLMLLFTLHTLRRLYENLFVSVFSRKAKINLIQYTWGLVYYTLVPLTMLSESQNFNLELKLELSWTYSQLVGLLLFSFGCWLEFTTLSAFAEMRRKGAIKMESHGIPQASVFQFVSCPHYLGEVIIYLGLWLMAANCCYSLRILLLYNISAHMCMAMSSHQWYIANFTKYPKNRKALIPFIL